MTQFADLTGDQRAKVIARAWQAIGLDPGAISDELMAEWIAGLYPFSLDQIGEGVKLTRATGGTVPINRFVEFCSGPAVAVPDLVKPKPGDSPIAAREKERMRRIMRGEDVETKAESYRKLGMEKRWGPLA